MDEQVTLVVRAYTIYQGVFDFPVQGDDDLQARMKAREYAKRIILEGLWKIWTDGTEEFWPPDKIVRVKILGGGG